VTERTFGVKKLIVSALILSIIWMGLGYYVMFEPDMFLGSRYRVPIKITFYLGPLVFPLILLKSWRDGKKIDCEKKCLKR